MNGETHADIVKDMRDRACVAEETAFRPTGEAIAAMLKDLADRIEAAAKRERETADLRAIHAAEMAERDTRRELAPGNAAALRVALKRLLRQLQWEYAQEGDAGVAAVMDRGRIADNIDIAVAALAAPARNCDRFKTMEAARAAFRKFCRENYHPSYAAAGLDGCDDCELCEMKNMSGVDACPFAWLFAKAEGGAE